MPHNSICQHHFRTIPSLSAQVLIKYNAPPLSISTAASRRTSTNAITRGRCLCKGHIRHQFTSSLQVQHNAPYRILSTRHHMRIPPGHGPCAGRKLRNPGPFHGSEVACMPLFSS